MRLYASFSLATFAALSAAGTATFDDLSFSGTTPTYENGKNLNGSFTSGGVTFGNTYHSEYGGYWSGFAYSKVQNTTTAGYTNQYAAYAGAAYSGTNYGVSNGSGATFVLPTGQSILGMEVTNTTYTALSMLNGDSFAKKFTTGDYFTLTATGYANGVATGAASFNLADYRFSDPSQDYVVKDWTYFDLSNLGTATSVVFSYASSDVGPYGINTPLYFALDDVRTQTIQAVPEPATFAVLALGVGPFRHRKGGAR